MIRIGLLREEKNPPDTRVALTPAQAAEVMRTHPGVQIVAEPSPSRCFADAEYTAAGVPLRDDLSDCDVLMGVKEVPVEKLIPAKTYFFFSHTKKKQPYNRPLAQALIQKGIRMIDYECLTYADEQRILGFGFYAGLVGAHNGLLTWGRKTGAFHLPEAHALGTFEGIKEAYKGLVLPPVKIVVTGSGKVAAGVLEVMNLLDVDYVEPEDFLMNEYSYPVYTHIKGGTLYARREGGSYHRDDFHHHPEAYMSLFRPYLAAADILMNGVYWDKKVPRLFEPEDVQQEGIRMTVMADITCDTAGSVSINQGASTIADPVYGIDRLTLAQRPPFLKGNDVIDVMAVDNLPNELPRDASEHFGQHLIKFVLGELLAGESDIIDRATICEGGKLTPQYEYMSDYAY